MKRVRVSAGPAPYDVWIGAGALNGARLRSALGEGAEGILVSSKRVMDLHGAALGRAFRDADFAPRRTLLLPDGEAAKTPRAFERTLEVMAAAGLDRSSFVIAFGGGSIGDSAGFAAATYMRGIPFIQIPTTLLSMVDSSVGGKTGINLPSGKNLVGSFHQPSLVLADVSFLKTLPPRERQSGVYEILKCGLLRSRRLLDIVVNTRGLRQATTPQVEAAIEGAVRIKARIVERDEQEKGERILLNLGHTLGHALEAATSYGVFTHGEAVGHGMEFAIDLGEAIGITPPSAARRMRSAVAAVGPRTPVRSTMVNAAATATLGDKKRSGAVLKEILLNGPGRPVAHRIEAKSFAALVSGWLSRKAAAS